MTNPPTCGQGLAAQASVPEQLGRLIAATAAVLEAHLPTLDVADSRSAAERAEYVALAAEHRGAAAALRALAEHLAGCRELPMGRHVDTPEMNATMARAFAEYVECEDGLHGLLGERLGRDREMLAAMRDGAGRNA